MSNYENEPTESMSQPIGNSRSRRSKAVLMVGTSATALVIGGGALGIAALRGNLGPQDVGTSQHDGDRTPTPEESPKPKFTKSSKLSTKDDQGVSSRIKSYGTLFLDKNVPTDYEVGMGRDAGRNTIAFIRSTQNQQWTLAKGAKFRPVEPDSKSLSERYASNDFMDRVPDPDRGNRQGQDAPHYDILIKLPTGEIAKPEYSLTFRGEPCNRISLATYDHYELPHDKFGLALTGPSSLVKDHDRQATLGELC